MIEIIAEIGVNHNGDFFEACRLVDAAIAAGCNAVKTQLWNSERVYQGDKIAEMKKLELSRRQIHDLRSFCVGRGIELIVTPDEIGDAIFLKEIGVRRIKTSSQDVTNIPFLQQIAALRLPVIFSTGACDWDELNAGMEVFGEEQLTVLHCVSAYPAPLDQMNMKVMRALNDFLLDYDADDATQIGLSDHTTGNEAAIMALALGATVFEKHLTLDKNQPGPDHKASMTPIELGDYVRTLRECEAALGDGDKRVMPCEIKNRRKFEAFRARPFNGAAP